MILRQFQKTENAERVCMTGIETFNISLQTYLIIYYTRHKFDDSGINERIQNRTIHGH